MTQYLDCCRQLLIQFPMHFEYNEQMLMFIAEEIFTHKYGTFLVNCERERDMLKIDKKTESIWTYVLLHKERFTNKFYQKDAMPKIISEVPITSAFTMSEWRELHFKWSKQATNIYYPEFADDELTQRCYNANTINNKKQEAAVLRQILAEQE
jgi:hypothetical protein